MPCRTARAAAAVALHSDSHCCDMTLQSTFRLAIARQAQARLPACRLASASNLAGQLRHSAGKQAIASHPRTSLDSMATVVWLKRDLRLAENAPLAEAAASGQPTVVLYCYEPSLVQATDFSHCHLQVCSMGEAVTHCLVLFGSHMLTTPPWPLQLSQPFWPPSTPAVYQRKPGGGGQCTAEAWGQPVDATWRGDGGADRPVC